MTRQRPSLCTKPFAVRLQGWILVHAEESSTFFLALSSYFYLSRRYHSTNTSLECAVQLALLSLAM